MRKPDVWQVVLASTFAGCAFLEWQITDGLDGTEFSGGWLTGPLLSMAEVGIVLFILSFLLVLPVPRIAAVSGLISSLLSLPLCCFFIAPVPFAKVFAPGAEFSIEPEPGFHWHRWPTIAFVCLTSSACICARRLVIGKRAHIAQVAESNDV